MIFHTLPSGRNMTGDFATNVDRFENHGEICMPGCVFLNRPSRMSLKVYAAIQHHEARRKHIIDSNPGHDEFINAGQSLIGRHNLNCGIKTVSGILIVWGSDFGARASLLKRLILSQ
jgi:hypothetical protein